MKVISYSKIMGIIRQCEISSKWWKDGTVRLELKRPYLYFTLRAEDFKNIRFGLKGNLGKCFLIGREKSPPLSGIRENNKLAKMLSTHRVLKLDSFKEAVDVIDLIARFGWSVNSDVYIFSEKGTWMTYVGHHDDIVSYFRL